MLNINCGVFEYHNLFYDTEIFMKNIKITAQSNILKMEHITKIYSNGFVANNDINFSVKYGEIHGLVGENGAGKTTLMKVLFGLEIPEKGTISIDGKQVTIKSPLHALEHGIGMVHQHFMLVNNLSVLENMVLGDEPTEGMLYNRNLARQKVIDISKKYELPIDPDEIVGNLSVGLKQRVEILKILLKGAKLLLLDEPTAVLTPQETKELFAQLKKLREKGFSIVFISHKLNEVKEICDRVTVLKMGQSILTRDIDGLTENEISKLMVGRELKIEPYKKSINFGKSILEIENLSHINRYGKYILSNLSLSVKEGQIVGIAGVEGNGQSELSETIAGLLPIQHGKIKINGTFLSDLKNIRDIRELGVSLIHEDRMSYGVSVKMPIYENIMADQYYSTDYSINGLINITKEKEVVSKYIKDFMIKCDSINSNVDTLSGGNIQKVVAAREFSSKPKFLLACHPTRGIDIGAAEMIRNKIVELRDNYQTAVLLISADLTELLALSDSIAVMYDGEIVAYFENTNNLSETDLGEYMLGLKKQNNEVKELLLNEK